MLEVADLEAKLVDDVQQILHDMHVDTTWPTCPRHNRHPLWYRDGSWGCEQLEERVFPLGALPPTTPSAVIDWRVTPWREAEQPGDLAALIVARG